ALASAAAGRPSGDPMLDFVFGAIAGSGPDAVVLAGERLGSASGAAALIAHGAGAGFGYVTRRAGDRGALRAGVHPRLLPGGRSFDRAEERAEVEAVWGPIMATDPGRDTAGILYAGAEHELDVLFVVGADPLRDLPDTALVRRALQNVETVVVVGTELGDLAPFVSAFLPAVPVVERDGHLSTWEGRAQRVRPARSSAGLSRPDWEIFAGLALALGGDLGFETLEEIHAEMGRLLAPREAVAPALADAQNVFAAPDLELFTYPLLVDEGRSSRGAHELKATFEEPAFVEVHPDTARAHGLEGATEALVRTNAGSATLPLRVTDHIAPGAAFVPFNQPGLAAATLLVSGAGEPAAIGSVARVAPAEGVA
ncbi:MAG: molybdopterin-dependent oxidoreductase, partial [Actinomycetota bacterium]